ncbi:hypothetical protein CC78DRAFT_100092 [Lojkania enalia]|uniref:Uncharacterized protein n=1 Tax=Lojkania enalia TaxID=147567 RepID=A0A9P4KI50_9PLEO|nr:hypothetical protein CC78DRAFT_100092 [Didymosphaeria enalia]
MTSISAPTLFLSPLTTPARSVAKPSFSSANKMPELSATFAIHHLLRYMQYLDFVAQCPPDDTIAQHPFIYRSNSSCSNAPRRAVPYCNCFQFTVLGRSVTSDYRRVKMARLSAVGCYLY